MKWTLVPDHDEYESVTASVKEQQQSQQQQQGSDLMGLAICSFIIGRKGSKARQEQHNWFLYFSN